MYDVIVLGASFAAAGIAEVYKEKCLVLERRMQAGCEFFGALQFGTGYDEPFHQKKAEEMRKQFQKNAVPYGNDTLLYSIFKGCNTLFGVETVSVERYSNHFLCNVHGVDGYRSFQAKKIIDTRCSKKDCDSKNFNLLIESREIPRFDGVICEKADSNDRFVLQIPVPISYAFYEARTKALEIIKQFSSSQKLILSANEFDYHVSENRPAERDGFLVFPSKAYKNPIKAFEAGLILGEELSR